MGEEGRRARQPLLHIPPHPPGGRAGVREISPGDPRRDVGKMPLLCTLPIPLRHSLS